MTSFFFKILYYVLLFIVTYLLFVYPSEVIELLIFNGEIFNLKSLLTTLFINLLILTYFRTFNTNRLLKLFVTEGIGIGFVSFWITSLSLIFSFLIRQYQTKVDMPLFF